LVVKGNYSTAPWRSRFRSARLFGRWVLSLTSWRTPKSRFLA